MASLAEILADNREIIQDLAAAIGDTSGTNKLRKAAGGISQALGIVNYDLEPSAKKLFPWYKELTPFRNMVPRSKGHGDTATRWKAITGINVNNMKGGVSEGNRGGVIATSAQSYAAPYVTHGLENFVTFESDMAAEGFGEDLKADAMLFLMLSLWRDVEEPMLLGGNGSMSIGAGPQPTLSAGTGGTMTTAAAASVVVVPLTLDGWINTGRQNGAITSTNNLVCTTITKINADQSVDTLQGGCGIAGTNQTVNQSNSGTGSITFSFAPIAGAVAYAIFVGQTAGTERLAMITPMLTGTVTSWPTTTQLLSSLDGVDHSADSNYQYDGFLTQAFKTGNNAYIKQASVSVPGTAPTLTSDGAGGIKEFNDAFQTMYDNYRISVDTIWASSADRRAISNLIIKNGGAPLVRLTMDANGDHSVRGGTIVKELSNPVTGEIIDLKLHPFLPPGTILGTTSRLPYQLPDVPSLPFRVKCLQEYEGREWPLRTRKWEYGVYLRSLLQHYFPPSMAVWQGFGVPTVD